MKTIYTIQMLQHSLNQFKKEDKKIGFVPTMGFLHEGHLALVEKAKQENDIVVMSIFVNPAQFGPGEDFDAYPRNTKRDMELSKNAGVDILFVPETVEMYPTNGGIRILPGPQATKLCGASRPEHFDGVLKVVLKLFNIVDPDRSYFGMKDAQQFAIIETFIRDFNLRTELVRVTTVREKDGLAKSSRNVNLSETERLQAPEIQKALQKGLELFRNQIPVNEIETEVIKHIVANTSGGIDYVSLLSYPSLQELNEETEEAILACAVKFENTRLIDNIIFSTKDE
ncbi:pantoate--beta-alanine ligase [Sporosarcina siberiensis]|uniref:Pantothenate synthetase n=1 Tax=Sporosarcina siberiensis TaxID=1365606 RepID=A0ABW4SF73_9BACL